MSDLFVSEISSTPSEPTATERFLGCRLGFIQVEQLQFFDYPDRPPICQFTGENRGLETDFLNIYEGEEFLVLANVNSPHNRHGEFALPVVENLSRPRNAAGRKTTGPPACRKVRANMRD
jgi:hypothetical protein